MQTPQNLVEDTARLHGRGDLAGMLARDVLTLQAALRAVTPSHRAPGCWCGRGQAIEGYGHEAGCIVARVALSHHKGKS